MLTDDIYEAALKTLTIVESCCHTKSKFCSQDIWKGDLRKFVLEVLRKASEK